MVRKLMLWAFDRLYNEMAWAYDIAAAVAGGKYWHTWGRAVLPFVGPGPVLEVGVGQGRLLPALAAGGHGPLVGVDLSPAMLRAARATLSAHGTSAALVRAEGGALPFPTGHFATLITVFPAPYVATARTQREFARVLRPGGRWLWADAPRASGSGLAGGLTTLLGTIPGDGAEQEALEHRLFGTDLSGAFQAITLHRIAFDATSILVRVAVRAGTTLGEGGDKRAAASP